MFETALEKEVTEVEGIIRRLQQNFECPICLDLMKDPVSTRCDHKFCRLCLLQVLHPGNRAPCPICKESITKRSLHGLSGWNAIVEKVAELSEAFQRDTGCEFSDGGCRTCVSSNGQTDRQNVDGDTSHGADSRVKVNGTIHGQNKHNSKLIHKRKAEGDVETVIYIENICQEASRPCNVKSHINISPAFPLPCHGKHRKIDSSKDVTKMDDRSPTRQKQEVTVATSNDACVVGLVTTESVNELKVNDENCAAQHIHDDKDCIVSTNTKCVIRGKKSGGASGRRRSCEKSICGLRESELLACLADGHLGKVSGTSGELSTITVQPNPPRLRRSFRKGVCGKETNLPTGRVTGSKVMTRSTGVFIPNRTRKKTTGAGNVERVNRVVDMTKNEEMNDNMSSGDVPNVFSGTSGLDKEVRDYDKSPEMSSKVMKWLQTTADSVSPLSQNSVVTAEMMGERPTPTSKGGETQGEVSQLQQEGTCTRSRRSRKYDTLSCAEPAADVNKPARRHSHGVADVNKPARRHSCGVADLVDQSQSGHEAEIQSAPSTVTKPKNCGAICSVGFSKPTESEDRSKVTRARSTPLKQIFRSMLNRPEQADVAAETGLDNSTTGPRLDDPYEFMASPGTPRRSKARTKRGSRQRRITSKVCIDVVVVKDGICGRRCADGQRERLKSTDGQRERLKSKDECELNELVEKISEAESYDLLLSQQFRDMEQDARNEQHVESLSACGEVPNEPRDVRRLVGKPGIGEDGGKIKADPGVVCATGKPQEPGDVQLDIIKGSGPQKEAPYKPLPRQHGRGSPGEVDGSRQQRTMRLRRAVAGGEVAKDYGSKGCRESVDTRAECKIKPEDQSEIGKDTSVKEAGEIQTWMDVAATTPASARVQKTGQMKRKRRGKRSRQHWKKRATSGNEVQNDVLIVRQDELVEPPGEAEMDVAGNAVSCIPESTLEDVTNDNQSQGQAIADCSDHRSKSIFEDTQLMNDDHPSDDLHCRDDLELDNRHHDQMEEQSDDKSSNSREYELDGVILVPAKCCPYREGSPNSVVVVQSDSSEEDELPCSNETCGFEPMQGFELHVNAHIEPQVAPQEVLVGNLCHVDHIPQGSRSQSQTLERGSRTPATHNAPVSGSQNGIPEVHAVNEESPASHGPECSKVPLKRPEKCAEDEKEDDYEKVTSDEQDVVCSLRSSRRTFSLHSSPLLKAMHDSLELHNILCEAAEMMQDTEGSVVQGSVDQDHSERCSKSPVLQKTPVSSTKCKNSQHVSLKESSLKYDTPTLETSPKLPQDCASGTSEISQCTLGDRGTCQSNVKVESSEEKTASALSVHVSRTYRREQVNRTTRRSTLQTSWKQHLPTEKQRVSGKTLDAGREDSPPDGASYSQAEGHEALSCDREATTVTALTGLATNQQPVCADNLESNTFLSSDEIVLVTTGASDDISPPIRVPYAASFRSNKKVFMKLREPKTIVARQTAAAANEDNLQNNHHVESSQKVVTEEMFHNEPLQDEGYCKEILGGKCRTFPACESIVSSNAECVKDSIVIEEVSDPQDKGQLCGSVVMETMSSGEPEENSSVLSRIPPTPHEGTPLGRRVNATTRNSTQGVNRRKRFEGEDYSKGRKSSSQRSEYLGDSEGSDLNAGEEFLSNARENNDTRISFGPFKNSCGQIQQNLSFKKIAETAERNLCTQPPDGNADMAKLIQTVPSLSMDIVCEASLDCDKSSNLNLSSLSKRRSGRRRRISARRSLWSQGSSSSHDWLKSSQSAAASTPLIQLDERQSFDNVDLEKTETSRRVSQKCMSDEHLSSESLPTHTVEAGRRQIDGRMQESVEEETERTQNDGDIHYSELSTVDGVVVSCDKEDSSNDVVKCQPLAWKDGHVRMSSGRSKGCHADRSPTESARDRGKGTGMSQTRFIDLTFSNCCHDNLPPEDCHGNAGSPRISADESDAACGVQDGYNTNQVTSDEDRRNIIDDDTDDMSSTHSKEGHQSCDHDTSDVDDFVLPTPQKQKPLLTVAMEIHSGIMDDSDDSDSSSPEGATGAAATCDGIDGHFAVKMEPDDEEAIDVMSHNADGSTDAIWRPPGTPLGNPTRVVTALPTTPSQPLWVEDRDVGSQEEWERIRKNIDADLTIGRTDIPCLGEEGGEEDVSVLLVKGVNHLDSDEDKEIIVLENREEKNTKLVTQVDNDDSDSDDTPGGSTCRHWNMTSSSGLSSQSELPITQCKKKLESEVKCLQQQILQMEAVIAAGEESNRGDGSHGDTIDCHSVNRTMSETVQCVSATFSKETNNHLRNKKMSSCGLIMSPRRHEMSLSGSAKKTSQSSLHSSSHGNSFVDLVDSDGSECGAALSSDNRDNKIQRQEGQTRETDVSNQTHSMADEELSCHSNKEKGCDIEENEDVDHCVVRRHDNHTEVDGEREGECEMETDNESGLDSDEDLFAPSEDVCIPQTLSQEGTLVMPQYVSPLLTSTPRPSHEPTALPTSSKLQTANHSSLSMPPDGANINYIDDEDTLPSLEADACTVDECSPKCKPVKSFNSVSDSCNESSQNKDNLQNDDVRVVIGGSRSQSVDVKRNGEDSISDQEVSNGMHDWSEKTKKQLQSENKATVLPSPVTKMVAPSYRRHQKEALSRSATQKSDFPRRPDWVFIASGINKTTQQPCIDQLVRLLGAKFVSRYSPAVTHVLVNAVPPGGRRCARTLKYFQGIAGGKWVINVHWALDSLTTHTLQPMEDYEITSDTGSDITHNAPQRARCSNEPLLSKYEICCHGNFIDLTRDDLCGLAEACGAMTIQEPSMFTFDPTKFQVIIAQNSTKTKMAELQKFQRRYQVALAQKEWLLDSVSVYDIQPLEEYIITGLP